MKDLSTRRCCHEGCKAVIHVDALPADWYKSSYGFMSWACPEHAEVWQQFNAQLKDYETKRGEAYSQAVTEFVLRWESTYDAEHPTPQVPPSQSSIPRSTED